MSCSSSRCPPGPKVDAVSLPPGRRLWREFAANCHHPHGFPRWVQCRGRSLPPHSWVCVGLSVQCFLPACFPLSSVLGRSATFTSTFPAPGHPPGCCCLGAISRDQALPYIHSTAGATTCRRGSGHLPSQDPSFI